MLKMAVLKTFINFLRWLFGLIGYEIVILRKQAPNISGNSTLLPGYPDFSPEIVATIAVVKGFTLTSPERIAGLCEAVKYILVNNIPGDIVECGVWKGGSMMAVARTLLQLKDNSRHLYLFDTFEGMTTPTNVDVDIMGMSPKQYPELQISIDYVRQSLSLVGYDDNKIHFVKGRVEETLPEQAPDIISLLRLDTDWYESTRHEMEHLFPRLSVGGVIIIDDYGHWQGARQAVDEYLKANKIKMLLNRIDYTGRIGVKLA
jgi:O-methyltransferase